MAEQQKTEEVSDEMMSQLRETFNSFDKNGDGTISSSELADAMRRLNMNPTDQEVKAIMDEIKTERGADGKNDKQGDIDFDEFSKFMVKRLTTVNEHEELVQAFNVLDKDSSGFLERDELKVILQTESEEELNEIMKSIDTNGDGKIDINEFIAMMT